MVPATGQAGGARAQQLDVELIRADFPILARTVHDRPLVYLDNAATTQKPEAVLAAVDRYYRLCNANVHRSIHTLGELSTEALELARQKVAQFISAPGPDCVAFTRNTTEAINLVAHGWARPRLLPGDEILLSPMEHHSNLVPWQMVSRYTGARLRFFSLTPDGRLDLANLDEILGPRTRLVALTHVSNVLGTVNPVTEMAAAAHRVGAVLLVDGAQSVPHFAVDFQALGADFLAFSGHKMLGPMGSGALVGRRERLEEMEPVLGGGEMIREVTLTGATWNDLPWKFEAGTPDVAAAVGLAAAVDYLVGVGLAEVDRYVQELTDHAAARLAGVPGLTLYGPAQRVGVVSFNLGAVHPHDLATFLDQDGIAIRAGHHCAQPLMRCLGVAATARASFYFYNTRAEVDALAGSLARAVKFFSRVTG